MVERKRITPEALQEAFEKIENIPREHNKATKSFYLAGTVLRGLLGEQWFDRHVMPNKRKPGFLTINETTGQTLDMSAFRIMDLAELIYNLQHISGFDQYPT
jgi:hypothetical protein